MAGAAKRRAHKDGNAGTSHNNSNNNSQASPSVRQSTGTSTSTDTDQTPPSIGQGDGNRETRPTPINVDYRNLENIGIRVHSTVQGDTRAIGVARPAPCTLGREVAIKLNSYNVTAFPSKLVFQHDVKVFAISKDPAKNGKIVDTRNILRKLWNSGTVKKVTGNGWVYDGNAIAWSLTQLPKKASFVVDLNIEQGRPTSRSGSNTFTVEIGFTKKLDFAPLQGWLNKTSAWHDSNIETMSFLDHLLRAYPATKYHEQRKSYFSRAQGTFEEIGAGSRTGPTGIECARGVFASLRPGFAINGGARLTVNVDLANTTFFQPGSLVDLAYKIAGHRNVDTMLSQFRDLYSKAHRIANTEQDIQKSWRKEPLYASWKRLFRLKVFYKHRPANANGTRELYSIDKVCLLTAGDHSFLEEQKDDQGNVISSKYITVRDYFQKKYKHTSHGMMPLVKMTKGDMVPMDLLEVPQFQRYPFKLQGSETDHMLKFCVSPPPQRWQSVENGIRMLDWPQDPYLKNYGLAIDKAPVVVKARYLDRPTIAFKELKSWDPKIMAQVNQASGGNKKAAPKGSINGYPLDNGRWDLQGVQFSRANRAPLKSWGFAIVNATQRDTTSILNVQNWCKMFVQTYQSHGGLIERTQPPITFVQAADGGDMILKAWNHIGKACNQPPQLIFWVLPGKIAELYRRIKKSCDCRFGAASQCMQSAHIEKVSAQYCSNIAMKVNAKLGGITCRTYSPLLQKLAAASAKKLTMIIGADVSHAAPGQVQASTASMTMSMDQFFCQYLARCETNGHRVEMIQTRGIETMLKPMFKNWMTVPNAQNGRIPDRILYLRDGVSEGQYLSVITEEVKDMKNLIRIMAPTAKVDFTVVIAAKRHHIRFFPNKQDGDRNENPKPGVLVDSGVTNPYEFDWYMCSHSAIKGTARPVHYHVILNENEAFKPEELQQMIFEHSFQYCRSTTPISQHPAVMYAHLASKRADAHFDAPHISSGKKDDKKDDKPKDDKTETSDEDKKPPTIAPPLLKIPETFGLHTAMWFV